MRNEEVRSANYQFQRIVELVNPRIESSALSLSGYNLPRRRKDTKLVLPSNGKIIVTPSLPDKLHPDFIGKLYIRHYTLYIIHYQLLIIH